MPYKQRGYDVGCWSRAAEQTYHELVTEAPERVSKVIEALRTFIDTNQIMAYGPRIDVVPLFALAYDALRWWSLAVGPMECSCTSTLLLVI